MSDIIKDINEFNCLNIYNQYSNDDVYYKFFKLFKEFFFNRYIYNAQNLFNLRFPSQVIKLQNANLTENSENLTEYLLFYYSNIFGFYSPLGRASGKNLYDDNKSYDKAFKWDDMSNNGYIPIKDYITLITFFLDYSQGSWSYSFLHNLMLKFANTKDFFIEPQINGCLIHCVFDAKGKINLLSNLFTNKEVYGFTPLQKVKFKIYSLESDFNIKLKEYTDKYTIKKK